MDKCLSFMRHRKTYNVYRTDGRQRSAQSFCSAKGEGSALEGSSNLPKSLSHRPVKTRDTAIPAFAARVLRSNRRPADSQPHSPATTHKANSPFTFCNHQTEPSHRLIRNVASIQRLDSKVTKHGPFAKRAVGFMPGSVGKAGSRMRAGREESKASGESRAPPKLSDSSYSRLCTRVSARAAGRKTLPASTTLTQTATLRNPLFLGRKRQSALRQCSSPDNELLPRDELSMDSRPIDRGRQASEVSSPTSQPPLNTAQTTGKKPPPSSVSSAMDIRVAEYPPASSHKMSFNESITVPFPPSAHPESVNDSHLGTSPPQFLPTSAAKIDSCLNFERPDAALPRWEQPGSQAVGAESILPLLIDDGEQSQKAELVSRIEAYVSTHGKVLPSTLDLYRIVRILGEGSFGKVYLGRSKLCGTCVALKSYEKSQMQSPAACARVFQEIRNLSLLSHPNIIRFIEAFEDHERIFIVQELADGGSLAARIAARGPLTEAELVAVLRGTVQGLEHAHARRVLHRDIKPENVMLTRDGQAKIGDFGISTRVREGETATEVVGTPGYMAPEVFNREGHEEFQSDVWSLGVLCYFALFASLPFKGSSLEDLQHKINTQPLILPATPRLSPPLRQLLAAMLEKKAGKRIRLGDIRRAIDASMDEPGGEQHVGVGERIVDLVVGYGFDRVLVIDSVTNERFDHANALYRMHQLSSDAAHSP